jgi:hypothetical protein
VPVEEVHAALAVLIESALITALEEGKALRLYASV